MASIRIGHIITRLDPGGSTENTLLTAAAFGPPDFESRVIHGPSRPEAAGGGAAGSGAMGQLVATDASSSAARAGGQGGR